MDAAAAGMMALGGVAPPTADEFREFLQKIKEDVQVTDFIRRWARLRDIICAKWFAS